MAMGKVMIVEDDLITAAAFYKELQKLGYSTCSFAPSGDKAIETAEKEKPDVVLMDIKLKGEMDGFKAAREIRSRFSVPVIYMTGYPLHMVEGEAEISDPYEYLAKPVEITNMEKAIDSALHKHKEALAQSNNKKK